MTRPGPNNGIARNASQSAHPNLWNGLRVAYAPSIGERAPTLWDYTGRFHGAVVAPTAWEIDLHGPCLYYNGTNNSSRVTTTYDEALNDFTACAWFRSNGVGASAYDRIIEKKYNTGFVICRIASSANTWGAYVVDASASSPVSVTLTDGNWNHIAVTRKGSLVTVYGNGGLVVSSATRVSTTLSTTQMALGWSSAGDGWNPFKGHIGDVLIYNRALDANEIKAIYNGASPLEREPDTIAYYLASAPASGGVKTINGLPIASVKTVNGLAIASAKTIHGVAA